MKDKDVQTKIKNMNVLKYALLSICKVGIVSFNTDISTPGDNGAKSTCYGQKLALAIPANIRILKDYVTGLIPHGEKCYYLHALNYFRNSDFHKRYCVNALFLGDMHIGIKLVHKHFSLVTRP